MQKVRVPVSSFQYGEVSDSLIMRTDTTIYNQSAQRIENFIMMPEGSLKKRYGMKHHYDYSLTSDGSNQSHLAHFIYDSNEEYIISIEDAKVRCFYLDTDGTVDLVSTVTLDDLGDPLPFDKDYLNEYTHSQYGDVMFICHPLFQPRMLIRTSLTTFIIQTYTFDQRSDGLKTFQPYSQFHSLAVTLDPSATTGTGVTLTTSAAHWNEDHVGAVIRYGETEVEITGYTSPTVVVGTVIGTLRIRLKILNPFRTFEGSTKVEVTHIGHGFGGGETITVEDSSPVGGIGITNLNGARTVDSIIDENTYTFTAGASATTSEDGGGQIKLITHAPTRDWDEQAFSAVRGYPASVVFHENRLCFAGSIAQQDTIWMSRVASFFNFFVDDGDDSESIYLVAATGDSNEIRYMVSNRDLQIFTSTGELYVPTYLNQAITPSNAQIRKQTPYGCEFVQPMSIDGATAFVQNGGRIVREYLYTDTESAYTSTAISTLAAHLMVDPLYMSVVHSGFGLGDSYALFTFESGDGALFTSNRAERRAGWARVTTNGSLRATAAIGDRLFVNAYDEYGKLQLCEFEGDVGLDFYITVPIVANIIDVSSLYTVGQVVDIILTGTTRDSYVGQLTVAAGGLIDLSLYADAGLTIAYVGKKFTAQIVTNPFDASVGTGPVTGDIRGITNVVVDVKNAWSMTVNGYSVPIDAAITGKREVRTLGYSRDPQVTIGQVDPLQLQVNGIVVEVIV